MDELLAALARKGTTSQIADMLHLRYPTVWAWYKLGRRPGRISLSKIRHAYSDLAALVDAAQGEPYQRQA